MSYTPRDYDNSPGASTAIDVPDTIQGTVAVGAPDTTQAVVIAEGSSSDKKGSTLWLILFFIIPTIQFLSAVTHAQSCPQQRNIPIYLCVMGIYSIILICTIFLLWEYLKERKPLAVVMVTVGSFLFLGWFIAGNLWIYEIYEPNYDPSLSPHCNKFLYMTSLWTTILTYIILALLFISCCYRLLCLCVKRLTKI